MNQVFERFASGCLSRIDDERNLERKAVISSLPRTDLPVTDIARCLGVRRSTIYWIASDSLGKGFIKERTQVIEASRMAMSAARASFEVVPEITIDPVDAQPAMGDCKPQEGDGPVPAPSDGAAASDGDLVDVVPPAMGAGWNGHARAGAQAGHQGCAEHLGMVIRELAEACRKGEPISSTRVARATGSNQRTASRYIERAVIMAVHGRLSEEGCPGLNSFVSNIANHTSPTWPEAFSLAGTAGATSPAAPRRGSPGPVAAPQGAAPRAAASGGRATLSAGGITMSWDLGSKEGARAAAAAIMALGGS